MLHLAQKICMYTRSSMHLSLPCIWLSKGFHLSMNTESHKESLLGSRETNTRRISYSYQIRATDSIFSGSGISTASFYKLYSTSLCYLHFPPPFLKNETNQNYYMNFKPCKADDKRSDDQFCSSTHNGLGQNFLLYIFLPNILVSFGDPLLPTSLHLPT